jgi:carboxylesterase
MKGAQDLIYLVHGSNAHTWWRRLANGGYPWWRRWSLFNIELRRTFHEECQIKEFYWSGLNTHEGRLRAGADLARAIQKESPDRRIHIVGHSHGGNVALVAVNALPRHRVQSVILLANPNIVLLSSRGQAPEWLYWGEAPDRVPLLWNLYSPQDFVQCGLARLFHGVRKPTQKSLMLKQAYGGVGATDVRRGEIHWSSRLAAHRAMHSGRMGAVVGSLLRGRDLKEAMSIATLSPDKANEVVDRGGWPGYARTEEMIRKLGNAEPFDLGNAAADTGLLFIHGFTASPAEMRPMAGFLAAKAGWRCLGPLLPGHGTGIDDMQTAGASDWVSAVEDAYKELCRTCSRVFLVGLSMGAVLACHVALRRTGDPKLRGLILMAPAFGVDRFKAAGIHLLRPIRNLRDKGSRASDYFLDNKLYTYLQIPLNRAADLLRLGKQAVAGIPKLHKLPTLMFVGDCESTVSLEKMLLVAGSNPWIRLVRLPRSRHILPVEPDHELLFETSSRFVQECLGKGGNLST